MFAAVLISYESKTLDKTFTYKIPINLDIKIGMKVKVPFGSKKINGFVLDVTNKYDGNYEVKEIIEVVNKEFYLNKELLELGKYLKEKTLCSLMTAYETMLPKGLKARNQKSDYSSYVKYLVLNSNQNVVKEYIKNNQRYLNQVIILNDLLVKNKILKKDYNISSINTLLKKGIIKEVLEQEYRLNKSKKDICDFKFTVEQEKAFREVKKSFNKPDTFLLYGITGSGKTLVYINLIKEVIKNNKTAIMLVPEISLTAQTSQIFYDHFGNDVAIFHSGLSVGEKYDEYLKIARGEVKVVIGTRSAIFTPIKDIGIIIIDEEHSDNYKQDNNPRYHARDMALWRSKHHNCPLLLGSATPSLESMARALKNVYKLLTMENRIGEAKYPKVEIISMAEEIKKGNRIFSQILLGKIKERLTQKEQVILLLNRRGYSTFITCQNCGYTYKCPHCEISLTYHKSSNNMRCHYCGYTVLKDDVCPSCHQKSLNYLGLGTEKLEQELKNIFKEAKIVRMDADTTANKGMHEKIINDFKDLKYDILLGTQMISKGLDFPNVSLVGVINADTTLNIPDYKSNENTFSLLNQVSGRAGRSKIAGEVILQTFNPDNFTLECVEENNYLKYFNYEMNIRKTLKYPPYVYLASLKVVSKDYDLASKEATKVTGFLRKNLTNKEIVLGPTTATMFKNGDNYRFQITIKYKDEQKLLVVLKELEELYKLNRKVYLEIDLNPSRI
ncbi:MAG TPA: primosomal protein N' [Bacilli bacterium]|nr:primosomal protein N' [Bacilli bacterium]